MRKGFTLIEVLIVVIILGILATIALPQFNKVVERARTSEAITNIGAIRTALAIYYIQYSTYWACDSLDTAALISGSLDAEVTAGLWTYNIDSAGDDDYTVISTRVAPGPYTGNTIMQEEDGDWSGSHPFAP